MKTMKIWGLMLLLPAITFAQDQQRITLNQALDLGIQNSKQLQWSENKIEEAQARLRAVKDNALPAAQTSLLFNHAEIPTRHLNIDGAGSLRLPARANAFVGTASIEEMIYGGGRLRYAEASTRLLTEVAKLDAEKSKEEISYAIIETYFSLFKIGEGKKVVAQNLASIASQLKQAQRFFEQGLVTKNDVLRFQLQQANVSLTALELENNRKVINYNLSILLGLPENTEIETINPQTEAPVLATLQSYEEAALQKRAELRQLDVRQQVAEVNVKSIKANNSPTIGIGANAYYLNPGGHVIPKADEYLVPLTVGANISWNIGNLWTNKNKISEAQVQQKGLRIQKNISADQVKREVNSSYQNYLLAKERITILETAIAQATENDRLLASKYQNNVASVTDRIDAEILLYQAKINLELAKADAGLAYYTLLKSTGNIAHP